MMPKKQPQPNADLTAFLTSLQALGFRVKSPNLLVFTQKGGYEISVRPDKDKWQNSSINYGPGIKVHHRSTSGFQQPETLVVLTCVVGLLLRGYAAKAIELETTWTLGHGGSGRLDILLRDPKGHPYAMIECKTPGREYAKERNNTLEDGGQLLSYFLHERDAKALYLYSSSVVGIPSPQVVEAAEFIRSDGLKGSNVEEVHANWGGTLEPSGLFHPSAGLYDDRFRGITKSELLDLTRETGQGVFDSFAETLRRHVVSDKPNAFNKIFNLFLCKIADEDDKSDGEEMDFQWRFGDTGEDLLARLAKLYSRGMSEYLKVEVEDDYHGRQNEFAFIDIFSKATFEHNLLVLREVVELLQRFRIKYSARQQNLGDFFEMLLSTGLKQEAGQFFTPVPLARAIIRALPIRDVIERKIVEKRADILPHSIDFACGAGHFITELIQEIHEVSEDVDVSRLTAHARTRFQNGRAAYGWASEFVFGIEKDHRLAKVTKIATFLNGDGDAQILNGDGLAPFRVASGYRPILTSTNPRRLGKMDVVVANPPFSIANFRRDVQGGAQGFRLYKHLTPQSGEIECLFLERTSQLLSEGGSAGIIFPLSLLGSGLAIYAAARRLLAIDFQVCGLLELRDKTFIATPTTTVCCFLRRRFDAEVMSAAQKLLTPTKNTRASLDSVGVVSEHLFREIKGLPKQDARTLIEAAYDSDVLAHGLRTLVDAGRHAVVGFTGNDVQGQHRVLGYRFSKARGSEGLTLFEENGVIQTLLYDPESLDNQGRFSGAVLALMEGRPLEIPSTAAHFMARVESNDIWKQPSGLLENPSAFFVSDATVESVSPFGDFLDALSGNGKETLGKWLDTGRVAWVKGAKYPKGSETPKETPTKILTASNIDLRSRKITLGQFRFLSSASDVSAQQKPTIGDIVVCTASGSLEHLGKIACVDQPVDAYIGGFLCILRCADTADQKILEYNFLSARFRQIVAAGKEQNINNLTRAKLGAFELLVPSDKKAFISEVRRQEKPSKPGRP